MTGQQLKDLTTELLGGRELGDTLFLQLLNMAKGIIEGERDWRYLLTEDSANSAAAGDTYLTMKTIPSRFLFPVSRDPVVLRNGTSVVTYQTIGFTKRHDNQLTPGLVYFDYKNSQFALCGGVSQAYTIYLYYIAESADLTLTTSWTFPTFAHPLLAYYVAALHKGGIDYDDVNRLMAPENRSIVDTIRRRLVQWDDKLKRLELSV